MDRRYSARRAHRRLVSFVWVCESASLTRHASLSPVADFIRAARAAFAGARAGRVCGAAPAVHRRGGDQGAAVALRRDAGLRDSLALRGPHDARSRARAPPVAPDPRPARAGKTAAHVHAAAHDYFLRRSAAIRGVAGGDRRHAAQIDARIGRSSDADAHADAGGLARHDDRSTTADPPDKFSPQPPPVGQGRDERLRDRARRQL